MQLFMKNVLAASAALWLGLAAGGHADTPVTYTQAGQALFRFDVPDFWMLRTGGMRDIEDTQLGDTRAVARVMGLRPVTDDKVWMGFVSPTGVATIRDGVRYLQDIDKFLVNDPQVTSTSDMSIGGRPAKVIRGTGRRDGRGVSFTATVIDLPRDRVAVSVAVIRDGADPAYADELNAVYASFRPLQ